MDTVRVGCEELRTFVTEILARAGVPRDEAAVVADCIVSADRRGIPSHGVSRLPVYLTKLEAGSIEKATHVEVLRESQSTALLSGGNGWGPVAGKSAMELAVEKASRTGAAFVGVRESNHFGIAAYYAMMALRRDMIGIALTNSTPLMAPWGSRQAYLGTNPICVAVPAGQEKPIVYDGATSVANRGKLVLASIRGKSVPCDWAIDPQGHPTTDPAAGLKGALLPIGGYKGSGLAVIVDVFCGVLTGGLFGSAVGDLYDASSYSGVGHFFGAIRVDCFMPVDEFKARIDAFVSEIRSLPKAEGVGRIYLPGEIEFEKEKEARRLGVALDRKVLNDLKTIAARYDVRQVGEIA